MKTLNLLFTFLFLVLISVCCQAQSQAQSNTETKTVLNSTPLSATPANESLLKEEVSPSQQSVNSGNMRMVDGRKVHVDHNGVQSLAVPESTPLVAPLKRDATGNPE